MGGMIGVGASFLDYIKDDIEPLAENLLGVGLVAVTNVAYSFYQDEEPGSAAMNLGYATVAASLTYIASNYLISLF